MQHVKHAGLHYVMRCGLSLSYGQMCVQCTEELIASGSADSSVRLWNYTGMSMKHVVHTHTHTLSLSLSPSLCRYLLTHFDRTYRIC